MTLKLLTLYNSVVMHLRIINFITMSNYVAKVFLIIVKIIASYVSGEILNLSCIGKKQSLFHIQGSKSRV